MIYNFVLHPSAPNPKDLIVWVAGGVSAAITETAAAVDVLDAVVTAALPPVPQYPGGSIVERPDDIQRFLAKDHSKTNQEILAIIQCFLTVQNNG